MLTAALNRGRALARARMTSAATIRRKGAPLPIPPGEVTQTHDWTTVTTDVPLRLDDPGQARTIEVGGQRFEQATALGHLPWDFADLEDGDLLDVTAGESVGRVFEVVDALLLDQKTARRVPLREVRRPAEWGSPADLVAASVLGDVLTADPGTLAGDVFTLTGSNVTSAGDVLMIEVA